MECKNCNKEVKKGNKFCNNSCSASFNNKGRERSEESRKKTSDKLKVLNLPENEIVEKYKNGLSTTIISTEYNVVRSTIIKVLRKHEVYQKKTNVGRYCNIHSCLYTSDSVGVLRCSKCSSLNVSNRRRQLKVLAVEYKGGKCERCAYNKCISALEFHHTNPNEKDFQISKSIKSWEKIKPELDKCILVCSNCHREIHDELRKE